MNEFKTKDLVLATYLKYNDVPLASGYDQASKSWVFADEDTCNELSLSLHNGKALVEVLKYESVRRNLLGMAHDSKK
jgi:hypothetical protein